MCEKVALCLRTIVGGSTEKIHPLVSGFKLPGVRSRSACVAKGI